MARFDVATVVERGPYRDTGGVGAQGETPTRFIPRKFSVNIQPDLIPSCTIKVVDTHVA